MSHPEFRSFPCSVCVGTFDGRSGAHRSRCFNNPLIPFQHPFEIFETKRFRIRNSFCRPDGTQASGCYCPGNELPGYFRVSPWDTCPFHPVLHLRCSGDRTGGQCGIQSCVINGIYHADRFIQKPLPVQHPGRITPGTQQLLRFQPGSRHLCRKTR